MSEEELKDKVNRIDRNLQLLLDNLPLLKRAISDHDLKQAIADQQAKVEASAWRFIKKMNSKKEKTTNKG